MSVQLPIHPSIHQSLLNLVLLLLILIILGLVVVGMQLGQHLVSVRVSALAVVLCNIVGDLRNSNY